MTVPRTRLRFLPAILWLAVIFFLSSQTGEQTAAISLAIARWLARLFPGVSLTSLHLALRKAAHIGVYFVEGALLFPALYGQKGRAGRALALTVALRHDRCRGRSPQARYPRPALLVAGGGPEFPRRAPRRRAGAGHRQTERETGAPASRAIDLFPTRRCTCGGFLL